MSKEYLDKNRLKIEFHKLGHYTNQVCKEFLVHDVNELIDQICQLKPKNQVIVAEGKITDSDSTRNTLKFIFSEGKYDFINFPYGKKVKIIIESEE